MQNRRVFPRKYKRNSNQSKANDELVTPVEKSLDDSSNSEQPDHCSDDSSEPVNTSGTRTRISTDNRNVIQPSINRSSVYSMKSLKMIFPSTSETQYEQMFLLEKIALIYIEIVIKRGYKAMTNRPFRNLAK